ncbi:MAG: hypothetical protein ACWGOL_01705 [Desulfuromonadales bacterium]
MPRLIWILCLMALGVAACATTKVESVWKDKAQTGKLDKVFVLAVLKEPANRDAVEYGIANILNADTLRAIPTLDFFPNLDQIDKAKARAMIKEYGIDGALVIRLVDQRVEKVFVPGTSYYDALYGNRYAGGWYNYYAYGYDAFWRPGYTTADYISTVETAIYDIATDKIIWSTVTETRENTVPGAINSYLKAIDKSLTASGLF